MISNEISCYHIEQILYTHKLSLGKLGVFGGSIWFKWDERTSKQKKHMSDETTIELLRRLTRPLVSPWGIPLGMPLVIPLDIPLAIPLGIPLQALKASVAQTWLRSSWLGLSVIAQQLLLSFCFFVPQQPPIPADIPPEPIRTTSEPIVCQMNAIGTKSDVVDQWRLSLLPSTH